MKLFIKIWFMVAFALILFAACFAALVHAIVIATSYSQYISYILYAMAVVTTISLSIYGMKR